MPALFDLARWAAATAGRRAQAGLTMAATAAGLADGGALAERVRAQDERLARLEGLLAEQAAGLDRVRAQVGSLVVQLNRQLLPVLDERINETERDLARLATRLVRGAQEAERRESRLAAAERRIGDLRERAARLEQRTGLWRELLGDVARLGEELDALRARLGEAGAQHGQHGQHGPHGLPRPRTASATADRPDDVLSTIRNTPENLHQ